jgi:hypothetical protein
MLILRIREHIVSLLYLWRAKGIPKIEEDVFAGAELLKV